MSTAVKLTTTAIVLMLIGFGAWLFNWSFIETSFVVACVSLYVAVSAAIDFAVFITSAVVVKIDKDELPPSPPTDKQ